MNIAVRYHTRGGNTKKVAEAIARAVGAAAGDCDVPIAGPVDLLFLGGSVYGFGLDDAVKNFIARLNPSEVKAVALFGTSAIVKTGNRDMAKLLRERGIAVLGKDFYCRGEFTVMHRGRPDAGDLSRAAEFAGDAAKGL
ncbi:MAG: flavodoxin [Oscillospiraceae bacterium]|nr:flavodoxin [Oscillospiraceae bacterium]